MQEKSSKGFFYSNNLPLKMPSRLNSFYIGGRYRNKNVAGEKPRGRNQY